MIEFLNKSAGNMKPIRKHPRQSKSSSSKSLRFSDFKIIKKEQPQQIVKVSNVPIFAIVSNDSSEDIFGSSNDSLEFQSQSIQPQRLEEVENRQQVQVPNPSQSENKNARFKLMSLNMSNDGDASWTLQEQKEFYRKLKSKNTLSFNNIES